MSGLDPSLARLRARIGAATLHSRYDSRELTKAARAARERSYLDLVDPDRTLSDAERERRAAHARKADMTRLAYASAKARKQRAGR
jgi:hypothetical protein